MASYCFFRMLYFGDNGLLAMSAAGEIFVVSSYRLLEFEGQSV